MRDAALGSPPAPAPASKGAGGASARTRAASTAAPAPAAPARPAAAAKPRKLSYKEQRELDALPAAIEALEAEQKAIAEWLARPDSYAGEPDRAATAQARYAQIDAELLRALERWEALGSR